MPSKYCECCSAFLYRKVFKDFASVGKTLKMLQMLRNLQILAHSLNVAKFAIPS